MLREGVKTMKVNISTLMSMISEEEKNLNKLLSIMQQHVYSTSTQELDGKVNIIEDYKDDFTEELKQIDILYKRLSSLKNTLFEKNNNFKLKDGRNIQQAISDNTYLRKIKTFYEAIENNRSSKRRITEVHNSYFECQSLNYDIKDIKNRLTQINDKIKETDFEISKLNSEEFELNI